MSRHAIPALEWYRPGRRSTVKPVLQNMSAPHRTSFKICGAPVSAHTRVVSFVWALARQARLSEPSLAPATPPRRSKTGNRHSGGNWHIMGVPGSGYTLPASLPQLAQKLRELFKSPAHLFAKIGCPKAPGWSADFLIGYRVRYEDLEPTEPVTREPLLSPVFCDDPLLCAGILSRCAGELFLSRRSPILSWDTLLGLPLVFDDSLVTFP